MQLPSRSIFVGGAALRGEIIVGGAALDGPGAVEHPRHDRLAGSDIQVPHPARHQVAHEGSSHDDADAHDDAPRSAIATRMTARIATRSPRWA
jgi:hypothetical protein